MISLILPPKDQISRAAKMLADEFGTASNIKSRVNRLSVLSAITSTQQRLKLFTKVRTHDAANMNSAVHAHGSCGVHVERVPSHHITRQYWALPDRRALHAHAPWLFVSRRCQLMAW